MEPRLAAINPVARGIGGAALLASIVALYFQLTAPFVGSRLAYAGRLLGPLTIMLISLHLFRQRPPHPLFSAVLLALGAMSLLFVLVGLGQ